MKNVSTTNADDDDADAESRRDENDAGWLRPVGRDNEKCRSPMPMERMMREQNKNKEKSVLFALNKYYCNKYWQKALRFISSVSFSCLFKWGTHRPSTANCDAADTQHTFARSRAHTYTPFSRWLADWLHDVGDGKFNNNNNDDDDSIQLNNIITPSLLRLHLGDDEIKKNTHKIFIVHTHRGNWVS